MIRHPHPAAHDGSARIDDFRRTFRDLVDEVGRAVVGHDTARRHVVAALFAGGHVLLEGVPGLGKTLIVKTLADALGLTFRRIQFTPDLMPSDIIGAQILTERDGVRDFEFRPGPIFAHVVLADEINRATPKTQSAVLEAMEERQVTAFGTTYPLDEPFLVLATQNPIELEGTYPLPEAQLDRFMFKLVVDPPTAAELRGILTRTTGAERAEVRPVLTGRSPAVAIDDMRRLVREVVLAPPLEEHVVRLVAAATPGAPEAPSEVTRFVRYGPGPRAAQALVLGAKVLALADGRANVARADIEELIVPAFRHRLILNFEADAENVRTEDLLAAIERAADGRRGARR
jgi:MoxR-like ATPase